MPIPTGNAAKIAAAAKRATGKGLEAAGLFLAARIRETVGIQAPRKKVVSSGGDVYWRATTPAKYRAPVRKVSGALQRSVRSERRGDYVVIVVSAKSRDGFNYPRYHDVVIPGQPGSGKHKFVGPTAWHYRAEIRQIIKGTK